jgi:hypothetical protein
MSGAELKRKLSRIRDVERRLAGTSLTVAARRVDECQDRVERLDQLLRAIMPSADLHAGNMLAAGGECVARLLAGSIATSFQHSRCASELEVARSLFGIADTRASIAKRDFNEARRVEAERADSRAISKIPNRESTK